MTLIIPITTLTAGTCKTTDTYVAVDTTDTTQAATGTDKKYTLTQLMAFITSNNGVTWSTVSGATQQMVAGSGYIPLNSGLTTLTLPTLAAVGSRLRVGGYGSGGWKIAQNANQNIQLNASTTTTGLTGYLSSTLASNSIELLCVVANITWIEISVSGIITVS